MKYEKPPQISNSFSQSGKDSPGKESEEQKKCNSEKAKTRIRWLPVQWMNHVEHTVLLFIESLAIEWLVEKRNLSKWEREPKEMPKIRFTSLCSIQQHLICFFLFLKYSTIFFG